jgi:hypothetical protein
MNVTTSSRRRSLAGLWTPGRFLFAGGTVLLILGLTGLTGALGSISTLSVFNPPYWIDWFHTAVGSLVITIALIGHPYMKLVLTLFASVAGTTIGAVGLLFNKPALPDPSDHLTHIAIGVLAFLAVWNGYLVQHDSHRPDLQSGG